MIQTQLLLDSSQEVERELASGTDPACIQCQPVKGSWYETLTGPMAWRGLQNDAAHPYHKRSRNLIEPVEPNLAGNRSHTRCDSAGRLMNPNHAPGFCDSAVVSR